MTPELLQNMSVTAAKQIVWGHGLMCLWNGVFIRLFSMWRWPI